MHLIELKFGMNIIGHRSTYCVNFDEFRINNFFYRSTKKNSYTLRPIQSNSLNCSSVQMVHSIELKLGMCIIGHRLIYCVEFGEFRINSFSTGALKRILKHYSLWSQIIRSMLVSKRCFRLSSNLISLL